MNDRDYMLRAIELAKKGAGWTSPNPLVGAVIVKDGRVIGEGYHERYGELHAERNAIKSLTESAEGATIYVTLEPCCHYGKTPPCTEAIIENKLAKVVIGSADPNPKVAGKGVQQLREAGIEVVEDYMREECDELNPVFLHYITEKRPYVVAKYAMTADGKIACATGLSKWITGEMARSHVQQLRHRYRGIMVGIGTVLADDPMLNVRFEGGRSPVRIICDSRLRISMESQIVRTAKEYETIVVCAGAEVANSKKAAKLREAGVEVIECGKPAVLREQSGCGCDGIRSSVCGIDLDELMETLGERKIDSVLIEGGGTLMYSAFEAGIVNEVKAYIAPKIVGGRDAKTPVEGEGFKSPDEGVQLEYEGTEMFGEDILISYRVKE
ncbi:MAG: bifunctional diaminohydroxyphosphoribosylaminopyrimidine deaminase/5-amino-6-(5-phosphoribosylamino)uracil reductase RibD [Firmicutes bacterium]|nr:bifunctional diaminohydroxyphosphoribosylaminopyrimidine deaminase/5-amino-6-(5-phosphoribosylamino)uracil reductase RibD [Bacillota bacterium]